MAEKKRKEKPDVDFGLGGIFKGLGDLVEKLGDLAEKGKEIKKEGGFTHGDTRGVYGFSVRTAGPGGGKTTVEPFGNIKKDEKGEPTVSTEREPLTDLFEEDDHVLVVVELPGVDDAEIKTKLEGDVLEIVACGEDQQYRKEVLLPHTFAPAALARSFKNGVLKVRLEKSS